MDYAIIKFNGKQYKVVEGKELLVDKVVDKKQKPMVLLVVKNDKVYVGKPELEKAKLTYKVVDEVVKGDKIYVTKYKSKSRYRKRTGFRPQYSKLLIDKITI